jgi:hypothetical protein
MDHDTLVPPRSKSAKPGLPAGFEHQASPGMVAMILFCMLLVVGIFLGAK